MLMPKRVKRRRVHRGRLKGTETRGTTVTYGEYGLQALIRAGLPPIKSKLLVLP